MVATRNREESIMLRGGRTNNLQAVDVDIRIGVTTAVVGLSGSGKSSLAVHTLAAEGIRRHLFLYDPVRGSGALPVPVDLIRNLPPTYCFTGARSDVTALGTTVATYLGLWQVFVSLLVRAGEARSPATGEVVRPTTPEEMVERAMGLDPTERLMILAPLAEEGERLAAQMDAARSAGFVRVVIDNEVHRLDDSETFYAISTAEKAELVVDRVRGAKRQRWSESIELALKWNADEVHVLGERSDVLLRRSARCPSSGWFAPRIEERLFSLGADAQVHPQARAVFLFGLSAEQVLGLSASETIAWIDAIDRSDPVVAALFDNASTRLDALLQLELAEVPLGTVLSELSSGQRNLLALARARAAGLRDSLLVIDEISTGVHPRHERAVKLALKELALHNTVVLVEHRPEFIRGADDVIEVGPGAGEQGGTIVFAGSSSEFLEQDSITAGVLREQEWGELAEPRLVESAEQIQIAPGELIGLRSIGNEKSRLLEGVLALRLDADSSFARVVRMEDRQVVRSNRSVAATILGVMNPLRTLYAGLPEARVRGFKASRFSFNVAEGRCEACGGSGLAFAQDSALSLVAPICPACQGSRYSGETREVIYRGFDIADLLRLSLSEAERLLSSHPKIVAALSSARRLGVGYLSLGRSAQSLSNGELQRLWLARELAKRSRGKCAYLFDEPTSGLHPLDIERFVGAVAKLTRAGHAVAVASVDTQLLASCDRVYDCDRFNFGGR